MITQSLLNRGSPSQPPPGRRWRSHRLENGRDPLSSGWRQDENSPRDRRGPWVNPCSTECPLYHPQSRRDSIRSLKTSLPESLRFIPTTNNLTSVGLPTTPSERPFRYNRLQRDLKPRLPRFPPRSSPGEDDSLMSKTKSERNDIPHPSS